MQDEIARLNIKLDNLLRSSRTIPALRVTSPLSCSVLPAYPQVNLHPLGAIELLPLSAMTFLQVSDWLITNYSFIVSDNLSIHHFTLVLAESFKVRFFFEGFFFSYWQMICRKRQAKIRLRNECGTLGMWLI